MTATAPSLWCRPLTWPFVALIYAYKITLSPFLGRQCRFAPTCSQYALDALREHPLPRALALTAKRLARCHPLHPGGYDPVPVATNHQSAQLPNGQSSAEIEPL